jgi:hypothetical protein
MTDRQSSRAMQLFLGLGVAVTVAACSSETPKPPTASDTTPATTVPQTTAPKPTASPTLLPEGGKQDGVKHGEGGEGDETPAAKATASPSATSSPSATPKPKGSAEGGEGGEG